MGRLRQTEATGRTRSRKDTNTFTTKAAAQSVSGADKEDRVGSFVCKLRADVIVPVCTREDTERREDWLRVLSIPSGCRTPPPFLSPPNPMPGRCVSHPSEPPEETVSTARMLPKCAANGEAGEGG
jgi:hypothetical protein